MSAPSAPPSRKTGFFAPEGLRTAGFYAALFAALGVHLPFWPLWLAQWGLGAAAIGGFLAAGTVTRVVAGLALPVLADRWDARRVLLGVMGGFGALVFLAHRWIGTEGALFVATLASTASFAALMPVGDALGAAAARAFRFEYAHARSAGSAAFLFANLGFGAWIGTMGPGVALWGIVFFLACAGWLGATHPGGGRVVARQKPTLAETGRLFASPAFLIFVLAMGLSQASHAVFYAYGSIHWRALGIGEAEIGALWAFGVAAEVALMAVWGPGLLRRLGPVKVVALSGGVGVVRWALMALDPVGPALWLLQGSHALTFAAGHLAVIAFVSAAAPHRLAGSAQGLLGAASGAITAAAMALAAAVYPTVGGEAYWIASALSAGGLAAAIWLARVWDGGRIAV